MASSIARLDSCMEVQEAVLFSIHCVHPCSRRRWEVKHKKAKKNKKTAKSKKKEMGSKSKSRKAKVKVDHKKVKAENS